MTSARLRLGFIALNDCAPLAVAKEKGFFDREGLAVDLSREVSWANIRDKVTMGALDGAHMLGPLPLAVNLGLCGEPSRLIAPLSLNQNGSAVTVSAALAAQMREAAPEAMASRPRRATALAQVIAARRAGREPPLRFAVVFPFSAHNYELRYWLADAGIDPDRDVRIVVTPPARMFDRLASGDIDGFCVGEPWNALSEASGVGEVLLEASEFWGACPDKVFGVTEAWAERRSDELQAVLRALIGAAVWADEAANRSELAAILAHPTYVDAPEEVVLSTLGGPKDLRYSRGLASFPWRSHAVWFLSQMRRWGQIGPDVSIYAAAEVAYRPDLFRLAAAATGAPYPLVDEKVEGLHGRPWVLDEASEPIEMGSDLFFDGRTFDAAQPDRYVATFAVRRSEA